MIWPLYWIFNGCFPSFGLAPLFSGKSRIVIRITNIVNKFGFPNFVQKFLINNFCPGDRFERSGKRRRMDFFNRCETIGYGVLPWVGSVHRICLCVWPGFRGMRDRGNSCRWFWKRCRTWCRNRFFEFRIRDSGSCRCLLFCFRYSASAKCK